MQGDIFKKIIFLSINSKSSWIYFSGFTFGFEFILLWFAISETFSVSWECLKRIWLLDSIFFANPCQPVPVLLHSTLNSWSVQIPSGQFLLQPPRSGDKGCSILALFVQIFLWILVHSHFPGIDYCVNKWKSITYV